MLPFEAHLLAAGWPRYKEAEQAGGEGDDGSSGGESEHVIEREGSRGARMLFQARRWAETQSGFLQTCTDVHSGGQRAGMGWGGWGRPQQQTWSQCSI